MLVARRSSTSEEQAVLRLIRGLVRRRSVPDEPADAMPVLKLSSAVIVRISGGLANQMLCYKLGRYLASEMASSLIFDASPYENEALGPNRNLQLVNYPLVYDMMIMSEAAMNIIRASNKIAFIGRDDIPPIADVDTDSVLRRIRSAKVVYCDLWLALALRAHADNYAVNSHVLKELVLDPTALGARDRECLARIHQAVNPVAVHVRRGDFATHDGNLLLSKDYYLRHIGRIKQQVTSPDFFVFSDDIQWCRDNLQSGVPMTFVDWNDERHAYRDLYLASSCRHFILSNESTFSHQIVQLAEAAKTGVIYTSGSQDLERNAI